MHYYKRNIGEYHRKAGRLNMLQHGAYTLLLDACYDREKFPTKEQAIEWAWAVTDEEIAAVEFVLSRFFTLQGSDYVQNHISEELARYQENSATNKRIAQEREDKRRKESTKRDRSVDEPPPKHKTRTTKQETPKEKGTKFVPPTLEEVNGYILEKSYQVNAVAFIAHYNSNGWKVGKNKMKCWKSAITTWQTRGNNNGTNQQSRKPSLAERADAGLERAQAIHGNPDDCKLVGEDDTPIRS